MPSFVVPEIGRIALVAVLAWSAASPAAAQTADPELARARSIAAEVERLGAAPLWPGYEPLRTPLAIYTGSATFLFRHPTPPEGFTPAGGGVHRWEGRHPAATSNSSADIGGTSTATLLADGPRASQKPTVLAAVALHEAFHVYQRAHHKSWSGNEGDLFLYPFDDPRLLALRRIESAELRRALAAPAPGVAACHARGALEARRLRFAAMDSAFARYERANELNEGLATYIQLRAAGGATVTIPEAEWPATGVRDRFYAVGPALAFLLDRFRPGWQEALEADDGQALDGMLGGVLAGSGDCRMAEAEKAGIEAAAARDAGAVVAARTARRLAFDERPGYRVVIEAAEGKPLWPQGFDPLNVERADGGILHTRFLRLGNDAGTIEGVDGAADLEAFTEAAGAHPLFNGVRRVSYVLPSRPELSRAEGKVIVRGPGFRAEFEGGEAVEAGGALTIRLQP
jgi:hypothetical protein